MPNFSFSDILNLVIIFVILKPILTGVFKTVTRGNITVLSLEGVIKYTSKEESSFGYLMKTLSDIGKRKRLPRALILRINSPGGTVGASQELYMKLRSLSEKGIKIVALMEDVAASGGVYVAMAADKIVATGGAITGSIGVIIHGIDYSQILDTIGFKTNTIKSGEFKDIMSPNRPMTDSERALLNGVITNAYEQFVATVASRREIEIEQVRLFADGRIFTGEQALAYGLVDKVGGFDDAIDTARELAGVPKGSDKLETVESKRSIASKIGFGSFIGRAESLLPSAGLSHMPLWLMPGK